MEVLEKVESCGCEVMKWLGIRCDINMKLHSIYQHLINSVGLGYGRRTTRRKVLGRPQHVCYILNDRGRTIYVFIRKLPLDEPGAPVVNKIDGWEVM